MKVSAINKIKKEELQILLNTYSSLKDVLRKIGIKNCNGDRYKDLYKRIKRDDLNFKDSVPRTLGRKGKRLTNDELFVKDSSTDNTTVKKRILKDGLLFYKCSKCKMKNSWEGEEITLQLDHINGDSNDHRLENLRFLCPNCHSQTTTFGRRKYKEKSYCPCCSSEKYKIRTKCSKCSFEEGRSNWPPKKEEIQKMLWEMPVVDIARELGVSDVTIHTFCKKNLLNKPGRGYWQKNELQRRES
tara:strand:+ start:34561 stop:35289 length:729 start_codon:yes stop_codon:yes gene_type:complete